jgi:outer membrane murein-binding lipoprotein Lpp
VGELPLVTSWSTAIGSVASVVGTAALFGLMVWARRVWRAKVERITAAADKLAAVAARLGPVLEEAYQILAVAKGHQALAGAQRDNARELADTVKSVAAKVEQAIAQAPRDGSLSWDGTTDRRGNPVPAPHPDPPPESFTG